MTNKLAGNLATSWIQGCPSKFLLVADYVITINIKSLIYVYR